MQSKRLQTLHVRPIETVDHKHAFGTVVGGVFAGLGRDQLLLVHARHRMGGRGQQPVTGMVEYNWW